MARVWDQNVGGTKEGRRVECRWGPDERRLYDRDYESPKEESPVDPETKGRGESQLVHQREHIWSSSVTLTSGPGGPVVDPPSVTFTCVRGRTYGYRAGLRSVKKGGP